MTRRHYTSAQPEEELHLPEELGPVQGLFIQPLDADGNPAGPWQHYWLAEPPTISPVDVQ